MLHRITVLPQKLHITVPCGSNLLDALRDAGIFADAPCGGNGKCGKCRVTIDGEVRLACQTTVDRDMTVFTGIPLSTAQIQSSSLSAPSSPVLAFDIGTTTVVGYLLDAVTGETLACDSRRNPQCAYGADVISRIQYAVKNSAAPLTHRIRQCMDDMIRCLCNAVTTQPEKIERISIVGNPAMQQLFLGIYPENLAKIPFAPVLTKAESVKAAAYLPLLTNADMHIVPDISGFVGADTVACILSTELDRSEDLTLLVDIGTNGEMVLGSKHRMIACSTAAGPALEGANISCGMRGQAGAIDHVRLENGTFHYSVIGGGEAEGICGSGLIDAVAAALDAGLLNSRGRIQNEERVIQLTDKVVLTQEDIRQVQQAKGAIAAGIHLMAQHLGVSLCDIRRVILAGAFGSYMDPKSACCIGLLPAELADRITAVGNSAGEGAKQLALQPDALARTQEIADRTEYLELVAVPEFPGCFARCMRF